VFAGMDKVILDPKSSGVVPYLPLGELPGHRPAQQQQQGGGR